MIKRTAFLAVVACLCSLPALAQGDCLYGGQHCQDVHTISTGGSISVANSVGGLVPSFEFVWSGTPSAVSITISGCGKQGTCDVLQTITTTTNQVAAPTVSKFYDHYMIAGTWSGAVTLQVTTLLTNARGNSSSGGGASFPSGTTGVVCNTSQTASTNCTSAQIATALNATPQPSYTNAEYSLGTCTTAATVNAANGNRQKVTLTNGDTCALSFTQPGAGTVSITLKIVQSTTSSYNGAISGCKWPGGSVPTITQASGATDFITAYLDGTNTYCVASQNFQ